MGAASDRVGTVAQLPLIPSPVSTDAPTLDPHAPETRPFYLRRRFDPLDAITPAVRLMYCRDPVIMSDGPTGSGKTRPALEKLHYCADRWPTTRILILRKAKAHASGSIMSTWENEVVEVGHPAGKLQARNYKSPTYCYPNGSIVAVDGMYDGSGYNEAVMGTQWDIILPDEATQFSEDDCERLMGRLNRITPTPERIPFNQIILPCNPDSPQHWLWRWHLSGKLTRIQSRLSDNPVFHDGRDWTPQGRKYLEVVNRYTGVRLKRLRDGLWCGAEGMIYEEWDESRHVLDELPPGCLEWEMVRAIDFGYVDAFVCQWWAIERASRMMILVRELVRHKTEIDVLAQEVNRHSEGMRIRFTVADHADAMGRAMLAKYGIPTQGCEKPKAGQGWAEHFEPVQQRLRVDPQTGSCGLYAWRGALLDRDPRLVDLGVPIGLIEEIPSYAWLPPKDGKAPKEEPQGMNDHAMAAMRYGVHAVNRFYVPEPERVFIAAPLVKDPDGPKPPAKTWVSDRFTRGRR